MNVRDKVRPAVWAAIRERGYRGVTYEGVASASGVAKTTLYRHWSTKAEMVFDFVLHDRDFEPMRCPPTIEGASQALAHRVTDFMTGGDTGHVVAALLMDLSGDPVLAERFRQGFVRVGRREVDALLTRSGLAPVVGFDSGDVQMALLGAAQAWSTVAGLPSARVEARLTVLAASLLRKAA